MSKSLSFSWLLIINFIVRSLKISLEFVDYLEKIMNKDREVEDLVPELYKFALEGT